MQPDEQPAHVDHFDKRSMSIGHDIATTPTRPPVVSRTTTVNRDELVLVGRPRATSATPDLDTSLAADGLVK